MAEQDRYEPKERLATGLGGERWRALDTSTGTDVVLAVLDARTATAAERTRFATVADASAGLQHPGLEKVIDRGTTSLGNPFAAHEIVEAPTFAKRIETNPPWSIHEVVRVGTSMLDALSAAHAAGLVHGDLEPERVQVLPAGRARVICFDLSRASQRIADESWHSSFAYMSPEQANGEPPTAASDVYGVGALIYRCITGIPPRALSDGGSSRERIIDTRLAEIRSLRGEIPVALATAVEKAVASDPTARFTSAAELRKALTSALIL
jgi:serine/threonine protein kinase